MNATSIQVEFNGQAMSVPVGTTVLDLLAIAEIRTHLVAVEINLDVVPKEQHAAHRLSEGDRVEVVTLVGGG